MNSKTEIRRELKARRKTLATDEKAATDAVVCEKLKTRGDISETVDPFGYGSPLAVYLASPDEINIDSFIEYMIRAGVEVVAPRCSRAAESVSAMAADGTTASSHPRRRAQSKSASTIRSKIVDDLPAEPHDVMLSDVVDGSL